MTEDKTTLDILQRLQHLEDENRVFEDIQEKMWWDDCRVVKMLKRIEALEKRIFQNND